MGAQQRAGCDGKAHQKSPAIRRDEPAILPLLLSTRRTSPEASALDDIKKENSSRNSAVGARIWGSYREERGRLYPVILFAAE